MGNPLEQLRVSSPSPPPRCFQRVELPGRKICGELASWQRPGRDWFSTEYFCDVHTEDGDTPISAEHVFRSVMLSVDIIFAGTHRNAPMCHVEAMARLERAVTAAGGLLELGMVRSAVVRSAAPAGPSKAIARPGDPE